MYADVFYYYCVPLYASSVAILKYSMSKFELPDHWYPSDTKKRAKIDEYLHWHHGNMRRGATFYFYYKVSIIQTMHITFCMYSIHNTNVHFSQYLSPKFRGIEKPYMIEEGFKTLQSSLQMMEQHFLKETKFINSAEVSIADILAVCELTQFWMTDEDVVSDRPRVSQWMSDVQSATSPYFDEVHKMVFHHKKEGTFAVKE